MATTAAASQQPQLKFIPLELIDVEEGFNVRKEFDPAELKGLTATVKAFGVSQPVRVRPKEAGRYSLVAGERRYRAAKDAELEQVPAVVGELTDAEAKMQNLIENVQRSQLNPIEKAQGIKATAEEWGLTTAAAIAERTGLERDDVALHLRLLKLPARVQGAIAGGDVPTAAEKLLRDVTRSPPVSPSASASTRSARGSKAPALPVGSANSWKPRPAPASRTGRP